MFDHGFLYGEGVYEVLRTYDGIALPLRSAHAPAACVGVDAPPRVPISDAEIADRFRQTMTAAGLGPQGDEAYLRLLVTRGIGEITYDPAATRRQAW